MNGQSLLKNTLISATAGLLGIGAVATSQPVYAKDITPIIAPYLLNQPAYGATGGSGSYTFKDPKGKTYILEGGNTIILPKNTELTYEKNHGPGTRAEDCHVQGSYKSLPSPINTAENKKGICEIVDTDAALSPYIQSIEVTNADTSYPATLKNPVKVKELLDPKSPSSILNLSNPIISDDNYEYTGPISWDPNQGQDLYVNATRKQLNINIEGTGIEGIINMNYDENDYGLPTGKIFGIDYTKGSILTFDPNTSEGYQVVGRNEDGSFILGSGTETNEANRNITFTPFPESNYIHTDEQVCATATNAFNPLDTVTKCNGNSIDLKKDLSNSTLVLMNVTPQIPYKADFVGFDENSLPLAPNYWAPTQGESGYARKL